MTAIALPTGGAVRITGPTNATVIICLNGGVARPVPGDWSPSMEWLVAHLAPQFPYVGFAEVRYRIKSWRALDSLVADARAAVEVVRSRGATRLALLGFSAGGGTSLACAAAEGIDEVIALAPWIPDRMDLSGLEGVRVRVFHGSLDGSRLGVVGVHPDHSRAGVDRLRAAGADASYRIIGGGLHGIAIRPFGRIIPLPRAHEWLRCVAEEIAAFTGGGGD
jgi:acetyl esterase/lipase